MSSSQVPQSDGERAAIRVLIPSLLWSYTAGAKQLDISPALSPTRSHLRDVLAEVNRRHPGLRFRIIDEQGNIRQHIKIFVDGELARDLNVLLTRTSEVMIVGALSGG